MDELSHWVWTLIAIGLWLVAVGLLYFFFIRRAIEVFELLPPEERAKVLRTRRQRYLNAGELRRK